MVHQPQSEMAAQLWQLVAEEQGRGGTGVGIGVGAGVGAGVGIGVGTGVGAGVGAAVVQENHSQSDRHVPEDCGPVLVPSRHFPWPPHHPQ
jgi:hypothetical protein